MVQIGSHVGLCHACKVTRMCGEFRLLNPRLRLAFCAECLERAAEAVRQAESREPVCPAKRA